MNSNTIGNLIKKNVLSVGPAASIREALGLMRRHRVSCMVVEKDGIPEGIFTERDIVRVMAYAATRNLDEPVSAIMSAPVVTAPEGMSVADASGILFKGNIRHLVAVDAQRRIRGVVSQTDLIDWMGSEYSLKDGAVKDLCGHGYPLTATEEESLGEAMRRMAENKASCLVVVNNAQARGIVTERDVVSLIDQVLDVDAAPLSRVMSTPVHVIPQGRLRSEAIEVMRRRHCRRLVVVDDEGRVMGVVTQSDILREMRWHYVEALRDMLARAQESEIRYRKIFENALHGIFQSTPEGDYLEVNPALARIYGYDSAQEMLESLERDATRVYVNPGDRERLVSLLERQGSVSGFEVQRRRKDGSEIWVSIHAVLTRDGEGRPSHVEGMVEDVTERRRAKRELEENRRTAESANRAKSEFLAMVSHEIRSPLSVIYGMNELLAETRLDAEQREYLALSLNAGDNLLTVISDILDITKAETGIIQLHSVVFNLPELVEKACKIIGPGAQAKGLELSCWVDPDIPITVKGDPDRLRQILLNFLHNAVKFTNQGHIALRAERVADRIDAVRFSVEDTGIGVAPDKQRMIFESFTQADSSSTRTHGGVGLGLSISSKLLALMGGEIGLKSVPGEGSVFSFTLSFETIKGDEQAGSEIPEDLRGLRALVADDAAVNRLILRKHLESWGMKVVEAQDGAEALARMDEAVNASAPCDMLLLDSHMRDMSGFDLAARVQELYGNRAAGIPRVVMLVSGARQGDLVRAMEPRYDGYLVKPVTVADLRRQVVNAARHIQRRPPVEDVPRKTSAPRRILLVDDDPQVKTLIKLYLKNAHCKLDAAENGFRGVEKFISSKYDLVLLDIMMPEMDGFESLRTMRDWELEQGLSETPVVMLTAYVSEDSGKYFDAGCSAFLTKPVSKHKLLQTLNQLIDIDIEADRRSGG